MPIDFPRLKLGVWQLCLIIPLLSMFELVIAEEVIMGAHFVKHIEGAVRVTKILKVASQLYCMSSCKGLAELVSSLIGHPEVKAALAQKRLYCQSYLFSLNLFPTVLDSLMIWKWGSMTLSNNERLTKLEMGNFVTSVIVCTASICVNCVAWRAFPLEKHGYDMEKLGLNAPLLSDV